MPDRRHPPTRRLAHLGLLLAGLVLALPGGGRAGVVESPAMGLDAGRGIGETLAVAERRAAREALVTRHDRLVRELAVVAASQRSAELRLRRLAADFTRLAAERAAAEAVAEAREVEVRTRQARLEALLAEIVQLSRDEAGDPRRLAQLRAVAAALAQPFAEARRALAQSRAERVAQERQEARLRQATGEARQAMVDASTGEARLAGSLAVTLVLATEAAEREVAARRMAALTRHRLARGEAGRRLAALPLPAALPAAAAVPPAVRRLGQRSLTARAMVVDRPARPVALIALQPSAAVARGPAGGQLMPVAGAVVGRFGDSRQAPFDRGLTIEVEERRLVRAPRDGRVVFARAYEGFGLLLIIDHGNEYHSLLSGLSRFVVHEGWAVRAGQMVGTIEPGSEAVGRLYVELRRRGVPVDPLAWFAAGQDKVRS